MSIHYLPNGTQNGANGTSKDSSESAHNGSEGEHQWSDAAASSEAFRRLDNALRDFVYGISRGYSVRHACRMSGEDYERMLDYLNPRNSLFKPDLLRLVEKARAVAYARQVEKLNASSDWHAAAFWLERREREFAPPRLGRDPEEHQERRALVMTPETIDALSAAYDAANGNIKEERQQTAD